MNDDVNARTLGRGEGSIEGEVTRIWAEVLGIDAGRIRPEDNFFSLGGDSLLIARVMDRVNTRFFADRPDEEIPITAFFTHGTVRALSAHLLAELATPGPTSADAPMVAGASIAIIGMAGRFPGAADLETFWRNLCDGVESIRSFAEHELRDAGVSAAELAQPGYVRSGALVPGVQLFDAGYFGLTPREASLTSPEQRLLIECSEEALQDAGYGVRRHDQIIGVFVGSGVSSYLLEQLAGDLSRMESSEGMALVASNTCAATRISYLLDLSGPSLTLDTACSSSLVAIHEACRALLSGECAMALAGGATVRRFGPRGYRAEEGGIFSPDGHCRPFDRRAQGTVGSSGAAMVLLKRLSEAIADRDTIHAVIRGTAVNNDGGAKVGYTAPSAAGQASVVRSALAAAGVDASSIQYLETHGTATALGDQIEIAALDEVFQAPRPHGGRCTLGTLKANIGHLEAAAGVAGLIKTSLALKHRKMPPAIHFQEPNEALALEKTAFALNPRLEDWPATDTARRAGVSSFGIGGTNAHAVLEEAASAPCGTSHRASQLLPVAARSEAALRESCRRLARWLTIEPSASLADVAHTLQVGRRPQRFRHFVVASDVAEAARALESHGGAAPSPPVASENAPVVFLFPGQGSQYSGMMQGLYESEPVFRAHLDQCAQLLRPALGQDLRDLLNGPADVLEQTQWCQPALFAVEYSLAQLWLSWGVTPSLMIGHSLGEYVAACVSGLFTLPDALAVVAARGRLMQRAPAGKMLALRAGRKDIEHLLDAECSLAAVNGPVSCVVSGSPARIDHLKATLLAMDVPATELKTSHAFHSALMDGVLEELGRVLRNVQWGRMRMSFISNLTGQPVEWDAVASPEYWIAHARNTVDFAAGVQSAFQGVPKIFLEVGPGRILGNCVRGMPGSSRHSVIASAPRADDDSSDADVLMTAVGCVWQRGAAVDWAGFNANHSLGRVSLPTYPFERERYWIEPKARPREATASERGGRSALMDWFHVPVWKQKPRISAEAESPASAHTTQASLCCIVIEAWPALEQALTARLASAGMRVMSVSLADRYTCEGDRYTLDARDTLSFSKLLASLDARQLAVTAIVHAAEAGQNPLADGRPDESSLSRGIYSVLDLCRALLGERGRPVMLTLLTSGAHAILPGETVEPRKAMLAAVAGVITSECPEITCRCIDVTASAHQLELAASSIDALVEEIVAPVEDGLVVVRGTSRWVRDYERLSPRQKTGNRSLLRAGGAYLVTGGLGGIGGTLAEFLGRTLQARLILVGRSPFPERDEWPELLAAGSDDDKVCGRIRGIQSLERAGAEVLVVQADVASTEDMSRVVEITRGRFGALHGVIHAAGVAGGGAIFQKSHEMMAQVLAPKVIGTWVVHEACRSEALDFFVCCSSIAAVLAPAGQYDYCAANAFQDAFCNARDGRGRTRYVSINWDAWKDVGMAVNTAVPLPLRDQRFRDLQAGISCEEGARAFELMLSNPLPQWILSTRGLNGHERAPVPSRAQQADEEPMPGGSQSSVETALAHIWRELLGIEPQSTDDDFFELGGDSLIAVQLRTRLESHFSRPLSLKALLSRSTLGAMARLLQENA